MEISDTHKARRSWTPGHRTGWTELNSSLRVESGNCRGDNGEQCFQFLYCRLRLNVRGRSFAGLFWFRYVMQN